jgi:hypothetical protein
MINIHQTLTKTSVFGQLLVLSALLLTLSLWPIGCVVGTAECENHADCSGGHLCIGGVCVIDPASIKKEQSDSDASTDTEVPSQPDEDIDLPECFDEQHEQKDAGDTIEHTPNGDEQMIDTEAQPEIETDLQTPDLESGCKTNETRPCYTGQPGTQDQGVCKPGIQTCHGGFWDVACEGEVTPSPEVCNGLDDNCDGQIDETFPEDGKACEIDGALGPCKDGQYKCKDGQVVCVATYQKQPEICDDGIDNNCDGVVDEGCPCNYLDKPHGVCKGLKRDADGHCPKPKYYSEKEICGDNLDNNCDGVVDGGCACKPGATRECGSSVGECKKGLQTCNTSGQWDTLCKGEVKPTTEICDGKDNNCNGAIDEGCPCDYLNKPHGVCKSLKRDATGNCPKPLNYSETEICDALDNDCNGLVDENLSQQCYPANTKGCSYLRHPLGQWFCVGACKAGTQTCRAGQWGTCINAVTPTTEICRDKLDNDCDGKTDEICGELYPYAVVNSFGILQYQRDFDKSGHISTGTYRLTSRSTKVACDKVPIFVTPQTSSLQPVSVTCVNTSEYEIRIGANATTDGKLADTAFYAGAPLPETDSAWGSISCRTIPPSTKPMCLLLRSHGTASISFVNTGIYDISSPVCNSPSRPIFVAINSTQINGYATAYYLSSGVCRVRTYDLKGQLTNLTFSFWLPNTQTSTWAQITSIGTISSSNTFQNEATWQTSIGKDIRGNFLHTDVLFPAWSKASAAILTPAVGLPHHTPAIPISGGVRTYSRNIPDNKSTPTNFSVLFIQ